LKYLENKLKEKKYTRSKKLMIFFHILNLLEIRKNLEIKIKKISLN